MSKDYLDYKKNMYDILVGDSAGAREHKHSKKYFENFWKNYDCIINYKGNEIDVLFPNDEWITFTLSKGDSELLNIVTVNGWNGYDRNAIKVMLSKFVKNGVIYDGGKYEKKEGELITITRTLYKQRTHLDMIEDTLNSYEGVFIWGGNASGKTKLANDLKKKYDEDVVIVDYNDVGKYPIDMELMMSIPINGGNRKTTERITSLLHQGYTEIEGKRYYDRHVEYYNHLAHIYKEIEEAYDGNYRTELYDFTKIVVIDCMDSGFNMVSYRDDISMYHSILTAIKQLDCKIISMSREHPDNSLNYIHSDEGLYDCDPCSDDDNRTFISYFSIGRDNAWLDCD